MSDLNDFLDISDDIRQSVKTEAMINREDFENTVLHMQNVWGHSEAGIEAKKAAMTMLSTKTGMYARIPLRCKSNDCPYKDSCLLIEYNLAPHGELCPVETAQIELRYAGYMNDFDLDESSFTDKCMISEIINLDVMMERCKALMAKEGIPVIDVVSGIAENGETYTHPEVSKFYEAYDKMSKKREGTYQLMMATRRDKKDKMSYTVTLSETLANMQEFVIEERPQEFIETEVYEND